MKKIKIMTLHANESVSKEEAKGISCGRHKNLSFRFLLIVLSCVVLLNSCTKEDYDVTGNDDVIENTDNSSLEISDFRNWFESQTIVKGLIGEQEPDWSKTKLKKLDDNNSLQVLIEIYKGKNSLGYDSIRELQILYIKNKFRGAVKTFSFFNKEYANTMYYNFSGQILEEGAYYVPKQLYSLLKRYTIKGTLVRLKNGSETPCANSIQIAPATERTINGVINPNAYNCHYYAWKDSSISDTCHNADYPMWIECPDIANSGYSEVISGPPQVGDRWVSYDFVFFMGSVQLIANHSAIVEEVQNGVVTKLRAKCGQDGVYIYNPDCDDFAQVYNTSVPKYFRK